MEPLFKKNTESFSSYALKNTVGQSFDGLWHSHDEYELIYIHEGKGEKMIGDQILPLHKGDLLFLGPNLPHLFQCNQDYPLRDEAGSLVIHIHKKYLGESFFQCPEFEPIKEMFRLSKSGIQFDGDTKVIAKQIENLFNGEKATSLIQILSILNELANNYEYTMLASPGYTPTLDHKDYQRINIVSQYVMDHFKQEIQLRDIAEKAGLSRASFCRHFKKVTGETFFTYLKKYRIGYACKLLMQTDMNISEVGYECGFNSISNFNKQFKTVTGRSPSDYQNKFISAYRS